MSATPPPAAGPQPSQTAKLRPSWVWFVVAAGIFVAGVVGGVAYSVSAFTGIELDATFDSGERKTVEVDDGGVALLMAAPGLDDGGSVSWRCGMQGSDGQVSLDQQGENVTETIPAEGKQWYVVAKSDSSLPAGKYALQCEAQDASFAVGPRDIVTGSLGGVFGGFGIGVAGFLIGGILALVVLIMRINHKRRLQGPPPGFGPPGSGPPGSAPPGSMPYGAGPYGQRPPGPPPAGYGPPSYGSPQGPPPQGPPPQGPPPQGPPPR